MQIGQQLASSSGSDRNLDFTWGLPHILTPEMGQSLKRPCFDIWRWEPKEMVFLMEHMYRDLGITEEMKINPITLRKWLVSIKIAT